MFKALQGFGEHVQLSVFRCDLTPARLVRLTSMLDLLIHHDEDQVLLVKVGKSSERALRAFTVLGRPHAFRLPGPTVV